MTPKEKAQDLFFKVTMISLEQTFGLPKTSAKQCALIAVDEIINTGLLLDSSIYVTVKTSLDYWQQVKQEIEKL
jgi:hypothetical protein